MLRVTKLTDYGITMMTHLAGIQDGTQVTAPTISEEIGLPLPTVRKILKLLTRQGLLVSTRGVAGGYCLAREAEAISLLDMIAALEGPVAVTECATGEDCQCERELNCGLRENWSVVNSLLQRTLRGYNLAQMRGTLPASPLLDFSPQPRG
ncbi:SUF system Fe-S cluster assembly regulator [bacterium DOLJORAL78_65_58]|nr:MAG: SUF system Fe-S cluster assembly regulator [bacterium DOLJORAL78_65_58]